MGGFGSGRRTGKLKKATTEQLVSLDIREWKREGRLFAGARLGLQWTERNRGQIQLHISFHETCVHMVWTNTAPTSDRAPVPFQQTAFIDWTPCNFGGERPWLLCPMRGCGARVAILYFAGAFACRKCCDLAYESQRLPSVIRASSRTDRVRAKLGWKPGFLNGVEWKPKGMHWKTFGRLIRIYEEEVVCTKIKLAASVGLNFLSGDPFKPT